MLYIVILGVFSTSFSFYGKEANSTLNIAKDKKGLNNEHNIVFLQNIQLLDSLLTVERSFYEELNKDLKLKIETYKKCYEILNELTDIKYRQFNLDNTNSLKVIENFNTISKEARTFIADSIKIKKFSDKIAKQKSIVLKKLRDSALKSHGSLEFELGGTKYLVFIADNKIHNVSLHHMDKYKEKYITIDRLLSSLRKKGKQPLMITNAGMFHKNFSPVGLYLDEENGIQTFLDTNNVKLDDNFHLYPNGVFGIDSANNYFVLATDKFKKNYSKKIESLKIATQSGPMLVIDSFVHPKFSTKSNNFQIRSGVGIPDTGNKAVFITTLTQETFYRFSIIFRDIFSCKNALYLDGAISKMYLSNQINNNCNGSFGTLLAVTNKTK